ncbi:ABC transporter substrate-binding protein [candidate division WOR-3 bacterium]|nr:ABC transporter substrate-binding protein [candidate division WOR-3 bacterium]
MYYLLFWIALLFNSNTAAQQHTVNRVISLVPGVTETIYALGAQDKLVGVITPCDYPPGIEKPIVGNFSFPNLERIISLSPDLVFVETGEQKYLWPKFEELGINFLVVAPKSVTEIYKSILDIGKLLDKSKEADSIVQEMQNELNELQKLIPKRQRRVLIEISDNPLITCGKGSFLDTLITLAGAINIAHNINKPYPIVSSEFVIKADPEVIIITHPGSSPSERLGWEGITAVKEERIYSDIDPNILLRPGPRTIKGLRALRERIYPELFIPTQNATQKIKTNNLQR